MPNLVPAIRTFPLSSIDSSIFNDGMDIDSDDAKTVKALLERINDSFLSINQLGEYVGVSEVGEIKTNGLIELISAAPSWQTIGSPMLFTTTHIMDLVLQYSVPIKVTAVASKHHIVEGSVMTGNSNGAQPWSSVTVPDGALVGNTFYMNGTSYHRIHPGAATRLRLAVRKQSETDFEAEIQPTRVIWQATAVA